MAQHVFSRVLQHVHTQSHVRHFPGRTHQLRRHMALLGHPILGDRRYTGGYCAAHGRWATRLDVRPAREAIRCRGGLVAQLGLQTRLLDMDPCHYWVTGLPGHQVEQLPEQPRPMLPASIRLWAIALSLRHPSTREWLNFRICKPDVFKEALQYRRDTAKQRHSTR